VKTYARCYLVRREERIAATGVGVPNIFFVGGPFWARMEREGFDTRCLIDTRTIRAFVFDNRQRRRPLRLVDAGRRVHVMTVEPYTTGVAIK